MVRSMGSSTKASPNIALPSPDLTIALAIAAQVAALAYLLIGRNMWVNGFVRARTIYAARPHHAGALTPAKTEVRVMDARPTPQGLPDPKDQGASRPSKAARTVKVARYILAFIADVAGIIALAVTLLKN